VRGADSPSLDKFDGVGDTADALAPVLAAAPDFLSPISLSNTSSTIEPLAFLPLEAVALLMTDSVMGATTADGAGGAGGAAAAAVEAGVADDAAAAAVGTGAFFLEVEAAAGCSGVDIEALDDGTPPACACACACACASSACACADIASGTTAATAAFSSSEVNLQGQE